MPKSEFPTEESLAEFLIMEYPDSSDTQVIDECLTHTEFSHTPDEWLKIVKLARKECAELAQYITEVAKGIRIV